MHLFFFFLSPASTSLASTLELPLWIAAMSEQQSNKRDESIAVAPPMTSLFGGRNRRQLDP